MSSTAGSTWMPAAREFAMPRRGSAVSACACAIVAPVIRIAATTVLPTMSAPLGWRRSPVEADGMGAITRPEQNQP